MTTRFLVTAIVYVVSGMLPPLIAFYALRVRFIGGIWAAILVGLIGAVTGGLLDTLFLGSFPDIILIGHIVDAGPPIAVAIVMTSVFALVSHSN